MNIDDATNEALSSNLIVDCSTSATQAGIYIPVYVQRESYEQLSKEHELGMLMETIAEHMEQMIFQVNDNGVPLFDVITVPNGRNQLRLFVMAHNHAFLQSVFASAHQSEQ